jgi:hypothetical protein
MTMEKANDFIDRIEKLDDATSQMLAFRFLLSDLNRRLPLSLSTAQRNVVGNVRAAILRATIAQIGAILDRAGDDRAGIGQIIKILSHEPFKLFLFETLRTGRGAAPREDVLLQLIAAYQEIIASDSYRRIKDLRNSEIGHILLGDIDTVKYPDIFGLADLIQDLVVLVYRTLGIPNPHFLGLIDQVATEATLFWNTYLESNPT